MSAAIRIEGVSKSFSARHGQTNWAARDLSVTVTAGESVGVIGPNGAGKTTLLRMIAGIVEPDAGRIERLERMVALIDLGAGFHPDLTGEENIEFAGAVLGMSRREVDARREDIRAFAGLGDGIHKQVRHFSNGMVARLAFAIAIHASADLLLVDEVLAVGDVEFQRACIEQLVQLREEGTTLVLVSHELSLVASLCDRVIRIEAGSLIADGRPAEVISTYLGTPLDSSGPMLDIRLSVVSTADAPHELTVRIAYRARRRHPDAVARLELGLPVHPAANLVEGLDGPLIFASEPVEGPWTEIGEHRLDYRITADGLPAGHFTVRVVLDGPGGELAIASSEFRVAGTPSLSPSVVLDTDVRVIDRGIGPVR